MTPAELRGCVIVRTATVAFLGKRGELTSKGVTLSPVFTYQAGPTQGGLAVILTPVEFLLGTKTVLVPDSAVVSITSLDGVADEPLQLIAKQIDGMASARVASGRPLIVVPGPSVPGVTQ